MRGRCRGRCPRGCGHAALHRWDKIQRRRVLACDGSVDELRAEKAEIAARAAATLTGRSNSACTEIECARTTGTRTQVAETAGYTGEETR